MATGGTVDDQTYALQFETMRRQTQGGSLSQNVTITHKELTRQCQVTIARHRSDTKIMTSELRRQQQSLRVRLDRLERDRERFHRDTRRVGRYLDETARRHEQVERATIAIDERTSDHMKTVVERRDERRAEGEALMRFVDRLAMPLETKKRMQDDIIMTYGDLGD